MSHFTKGTITATVLFTAGFTLIMGFGGVIYKGLSNEVNATSNKVGSHEVKIAVIENEMERLPVIEDKLDLLLKNQSLMASLQGIRLATSTP